MIEGPPMVAVPREIDCIDCAGRCHLLSHPPEEGFSAGDIVAYRCEDCLDRWDLVVEEGYEEPAEEAAVRRRRRGGQRRRSSGGGKY